MSKWVLAILITIISSMQKTISCTSLMHQFGCTKHLGKHECCILWSASQWYTPEYSYLWILSRKPRIVVLNENNFQCLNSYSYACKEGTLGIFPQTSHSVCGSQCLWSNIQIDLAVRAQEMKVDLCIHSYLSEYLCSDLLCSFLGFF